MILPLFFFVSYYDVNNYYTESHYVIGSVGKSPNYQAISAQDSDQIQLYDLHTL